VRSLGSSRRARRDRTAPRSCQPGDIGLDLGLLYSKRPLFDPDVRDMPRKSTTTPGLAPTEAAPNAASGRRLWPRRRASWVTDFYEWGRGFNGGAWLPFGGAARRFHLSQSRTLNGSSRGDPALRASLLSTTLRLSHETYLARSSFRKFRK